MKKLINKPEDFVRESLDGMAAAHPNLLKVQFEPNFRSLLEIRQEFELLPFIQ